MLDLLSQNVLLTGGQFDKEREYWLKQLSGDWRKAAFPPERLNSPAGKRKMAELRLAFDPPLNDRIYKIAGGSEPGIYFILVAAISHLLSLYMEHRDVMIGMPTLVMESNENISVNPLLPIRIRTDESENFRALLLQTKRVIGEAEEAQQVPLEALLVKLGIDPSSAMPETVICMSTIHQERQWPGACMIFTATPQEGTIQMSVQFDANRYTESMMTQMLAVLHRYLHIILINPLADLEGLELADPEEIIQLPVACTGPADNGAFIENRFQSLPELLEIRARIHPDRLAVCFRGERMTYGDLNEKSNRLARKLKHAGIATNELVAIMTDRSLDMLIGLFGILKAGAAYLPILPSDPIERIHYLLEDGNVRLLLTNQNNRDKVAWPNTWLLEADETFHVDCSELGHNICPDDLAYVIYTSGSTGMPKGVMVTHANVQALLTAMQEKYPLASGDAYLLKTAYTFDVSIPELFGWLYGQGSLVILEPGMEKDPYALMDAIHSNGITHVNFAPSMFQAFIPMLKDERQSLRFRHVKYVFLAGEALSPETVRTFRSLTDQVALENLYGPTEATVFATAYSTQDFTDEVRVPIGQPLRHMQAIILGPRRQLLPVGMPGELYLAGSGIAKGYWNRPEMTSDRFTTHTSLPGQRVYRTGDKARRLPDGHLDYLGREDFQVKVRGHRIELPEIEAQFRRMTSIIEAVATVHRSDDGHNQLSVYYQSSEPLGSKAVRAYLEQRLPAYMIPSRIIRMDAFPLTSSGKIDRKLLPTPEILIEGKTTYVAPSTAVERLLSEIWGDVLGVEQVGVEDSFFELGGDSIKAIQLAAKLHEYRYKLNIQDLFEQPTIGQLSPYIKPVTRWISQEAVSGEVGLSPIQQQFFQNHNFDRHHYNQSVMLYSSTGLSEQAIRQAFEAITVHHDGLRMVFRSEEGRTFAYVREPSEADHYSLSVYDLMHEDGIGQIGMHADRFQKQMNLWSGPLIQIGLFHTVEGDHLLIAIHHLLIDTVSWRILLEDLATAYLQLIEGRPVHLPSKTDSLLTWSEALRRYAEEPRWEDEAAYWERMESSSISELPTDFVCENPLLLNSQTLSFRLTKEETEHLLKRAPTAYRTEIHHLLLAALGLAVEEWAGCRRIAIWMEGHGREEISEELDTTRTIGWFTSLFPVILGVDRDDPLDRHIKQTKETIHSVPNRGIGYGIMKYCMPPSMKSETAFRLQPEISFNYLGQFDREFESGLFVRSKLSGGSPISPQAERKVKLDITSVVMDATLALSIHYCLSEYREETVRQLLDSYKRHLLAIISHCCGIEGTEVTPSDLVISGLTLEELDELEREITSAIDLDL